MIRNKILTWIFLGLLGVLSLLSAVAPKKGFSPTENRYLAQRPQFSVKGLVSGKYGKEYEAYLSDQFPGRNGWIGLKVYGERFLGKKDGNGVYFGKDGYLFQRFEQEDIEGEQLSKNIKTAASFMADVQKQMRPDRVRIMLVPSSSQIMKEKLPFLAAPYDQKRVIEEFTKALNQTEGLTEEEAARLFVPVEEVLYGKREEALYYKTDHHWTTEGAFYAYKAWAESMGIRPWEKEDFTVKTVSTDFHGTIYSKVNIPWPYDRIQIYEPVIDQNYRVTFDGQESGYDTLYFYDALEGRDQYKVFLDGNHGLTRIENPALERGEEKRRLLLIKDSYAHAFAPFAANHFETVTMVDLRYFNLDLEDWMEAEGITDVLMLFQIPGFAAEKTISKLNW